MQYKNDDKNAILATTRALFLTNNFIYILQQFNRFSFSLDSKKRKLWRKKQSPLRIVDLFI